MLNKAAENKQRNPEDFDSALEDGTIFEPYDKDIENLSKIIVEIESYVNHKYTEQDHSAVRDLLKKRRDQITKIEAKVKRHKTLKEAMNRAQKYVRKNGGKIPDEDDAAMTYFKWLAVLNKAKNILSRITQWETLHVKSLIVMSGLEKKSSFTKKFY